MRAASLLGGLIALVLLFFYAYLIWFAVDVATCLKSTACSALERADFTPNMASSMNLIAGLVSSLVIAELSVTQPGDTPGQSTISRSIAPNSPVVLKYVTLVYLLFWIGFGAYAFWHGFLFAGNEPETQLEPLADLGQAWLGIAVGAAYAYLGISRGE